MINITCKQTLREIGYHINIQWYFKVSTTHSYSILYTESVKKMIHEITFI